MKLSYFLSLNPSAESLTYKSSTTGKREVPFYMFLEKEYEIYIRDAVRGCKLIMPYKETNVGGTFYIGIVSFILGQPSFLHLRLFKPLNIHPLLLCHKLQVLERDAESIAALLCHNLFDSFTLPSTLVAGHLSYFF